jgi:hypothetical protein
MARLETRSRPARAGNDDGEEHLDDWFARRLDEQGIPRKLGAASSSRILAIVGLTLALSAFLWAISSVGSSNTGSAGTGGTTGTAPSPGTGNGSGKTGGRVTWKQVTLDVLNGTSINGGAASAMAELQARGWKTGKTGNASGVPKTEIVFLPGFRKQAKVVAHKLGLSPPVPIAQASGVPASETSGVALVLGPNQLTGVKL